MVSWTRLLTYWMHLTSNGYENYQDYLAGYDPEDAAENTKDHESLQKMFNLVSSALPLITPERRHLIDLCLKYGFQYKSIGQVMGMGTTETVNEIKRAIDDIKRIVTRKDKVLNTNKTNEFLY